MLLLIGCPVTLHCHRPRVLLPAPPSQGSSTCSSLSACHLVRPSPSPALPTCLSQWVSLTPSSYWGLDPLVCWVFLKHPENCPFVTKMLGVNFLLTTPYSLRVSVQTGDTACLLCCSPILPFLWTDTCSSILTTFPYSLLAGPHWHRWFSCSSFDWGGSTFSHRLLLFFSSRLRIQVIFCYISLNWDLSRLSSEILPSPAPSPFGRQFWPKFSAGRLQNVP